MHGLCVVEPVYHQGLIARQMEETGGELRGRASLVTVDVLTRHICSVSFVSLCADGARQVRLACAKPQTSSGPGPGGWAHEGV